MKLFVPALALVLAQLLSPTVSKQQSAVEHKLPNLGAMFLEAEEEALFGNLLNPLKCQDSVDIQDNTIAITVRVLVSKCLNDDQLEDVRVWLTSYVPIGWAVQVAPIAGSCTPTGGMLLSEDDDRFDNIFGDQFTVIDLTNDTDATASTTASNSTVLLGDVPTAKLIGMVSFVDNYNSLQIVQQYETKWSIPSMTTVVCGASDCPSCANCVITNDILMVDSFKFVTTLRCPNLRNAIPVSYLTSSGVRDCVCQCPTGYKRAANGKDCDLVGGTTSTCSWAAPNGFKIENQAPLSTCSFSHISDSGVPVPVAIDNYVAKGRTNTYTTTSDLSTGPHIDLKTSRVSTQKVLNVNSATAFPPSSSYPASYSDLTSAQLAGVTTETDGSDGATPVDTLLTWEDYRSARKAKVDAFTYSSYGKYALEIDATDYESGAASCQGCVAIVDKKRPTATVSCTTATSSDLVPTSANIQTINTKIDAYFSYQSTASNDACSTGSRCDYEHVDTRALFASAYSTGTISHSSDAAKAFFSAQGVRTAVDALAPFTDAELATDTPVADGQCKSCLKLTSSLREWWIDYSCGRDYAVKKCEGDSTQSCTFEQCYVLSGSTISSAKAAIKGTVQTESQKVLNQIEDRARFNTQTQVHIAIPLCTEFKTSDIPDACKQTANVNDLFDFNSPDAGVLGFSSTELDSLVKWRYKINTDPWAALHSNSPSYTFTQAVTPVVVEAWTKCGRVYSFEFKVHLHISTAPVCDQFLSMWYQTTHAPFNPTTTLCTYPKADFAEVTFDYTANQGLMYSKDKLNMHIQEVECRLQYKWLASGTGAKATVVSSTTPNTNIIKRIGVLAKRLSQTTEYTEFTVACDFRYSVFEKTDLLVKTCTQDFTIKDCTSPKIDEPSALTDKSCAADSCVGNSAPSAYEACGGNIVSANGQDTVLITTEQACCPFCSPTYTTACKKMPQLPTGVDEIKLCIPHLASAPAADYDDGPNLLAADAVSPSNEVPSTTVILLGVSAMVAVVALVVERRRRATAAAKAADDDAYYALLG